MQQVRCSLFRARRRPQTVSREEGNAMKLTLTLDSASSGVRASLIEEWDEPDRTVSMEPRTRHFENADDAIAWGRSWARRRGLGQIFLTDNRRLAHDDQS
jgi:hypothetical protein